MSSDSTSGGGSGIKNLLLIVIMIIAGFFAIKMTFWAIKWALILGIIGVAGYIGYSAVSGLLSSDDKDEPQKLLPSGNAESAPADDPMSELNEALKELEELKRMREE